MSFSAPGSPPPPPQQQPPYPQNGPAPYPAPQPGPYQGHPYPAGPVHQAPAPQGVLRSPQGLATALTWLLGTAVVAHLASAASGVYEQSWLRGFAGDTLFDDLELSLSNGFTIIAGLLKLLSMAPSIVVFIVWFHRVRVNGGIFRPDAFTLSNGWAIGGWFIPVGNLFLPFRVARQTWRASTQRAPDGSERQASAALLTAWWTFWILGVSLGRVSDRLYIRAETVAALSDAGALGIVSDLTMVVAGALAVLFVRRLTAMQNTMATEGPYSRV
ncbi:DUF4328 domain-containing protein [Streptomyces sp. NPDC001568]|uniref:DUF4328 domain-containing protein n=1 Tax=Streptomyces sp. NPDC001568 TaxID=3364588 RepID=UPI00367BD834